MVGPTERSEGEQHAYNISLINYLDSIPSPATGVTTVTTCDQNTANIILAQICNLLLTCSLRNAIKMLDTLKFLIGLTLGVSPALGCW